MRVLYVCHNHPRLHPGGAEIFAHDLFTAMKAERDVEALFLAGVDRRHRSAKPDTGLHAIGDAGDELLLWSEAFDEFRLSQHAVGGSLRELDLLLRRFRPDVVHFHHVLLVGVEAIQVCRRAAPLARIVYTLHDFYPICHRGGEMIESDSDALCHEASPAACHRCFPQHPPAHFVSRTLHLQAFFRLVDVFVSPSHFLRERFVRWGLPAERIVVIPNAIPPLTAADHTTVKEPRHGTFGCFGNVSRSKGTFLALEAVILLREQGRSEVSLAIHGDPVFPSEAFRASFEQCLARASPNATHHGAYARTGLRALIEAVAWVVVPSIWWENAPLVIQEAFQAGRPVICSDIGGMAESVRDGTDGLHFRVGSAAALAAAMARAMDEPGLWERCRAGVAPPPSLADVAARYRRLYQRNETRRTAQP